MRVFAFDIESCMMIRLRPPFLRNMPPVVFTFSDNWSLSSRLLSSSWKPSFFASHRISDPGFVLAMVIAIKHEAYRKWTVNKGYNIPAAWKQAKPTNVLQPVLGSASRVICTMQRTPHIFDKTTVRLIFGPDSRRNGFGEIEPWDMQEHNPEKGLKNEQKCHYCVKIRLRASGQYSDRLSGSRCWSQRLKIRVERDPWYGLWN